MVEGKEGGREGGKEEGREGKKGSGGREERTGGSVVIEGGLLLPFLLISPLTSFLPSVTSYLPSVSSLSPHPRPPSLPLDPPVRPP
jgi:hypothetical protein